MQATSKNATHELTALMARALFQAAMLHSGNVGQTCGTHTYNALKRRGLVDGLKMTSAGYRAIDNYMRTHS